MAKRRPTKPARPAARPPRALLDPGRGLDARALELRKAAEAQRVRQAIATHRPDLAPPTPALASPFVAFPVTRVIHATPSAVYLVAWGLQIWVPKSAISHHDPDSILEGWSGPLEVSSRWATGVGLPPTSTTKEP